MGFVGESGVLQSHGSGVCYYPGLGRFEVSVQCADCCQLAMVI